jgi:hypothetical protein
VGLDNTGTAQQASLPGEARETGSFDTFRSQDGSVLGLGPFVTHTFRRGGRSSGQRRASSLCWQASWVTRAPERVTVCTAAQTRALRGFLLGVPDGSSTASGRQRERRPVAEVARRLPRAWCLTEVRSGAQDTQREHNDTSHGVRFLSARKDPVIVARRFTWPTPSVLRVAHPLDGLIPPGPCGFVSRHSRP